MATNLPAPGAQGAVIPPSTPAAQPTSLDPTIVNLAKAIRTTETKGAADPYTAKGGSGEFGAYQYTQGTWDSDAKKYLGTAVPLTSATKEQQNEVAYKKLAELKGQGYNVGQIASIWNSGSPDWQGKTGTNKYGVKYDVPQYVDTVSKTYQALKGGQQPNPAPTASTVGPATTPPTADQQAAAPSGAWFPAATGEGPLAAGLKAAGNLIPSAFNFAKGAISSLNPINTLSNLGKIPAAFSEAVTANGGNVLKTIGSTVAALPGEAYKALVPEAARDLVAGDVSGAQRAVTNDPFGSIAPLVLGARGLASAADASTGALAKAKMANYVENIGDNTAKGVPIPSGGTNFGGALDSAAGKLVDTVAKPIGTVFGKAADLAGGAAKAATAKLTGLDAGTIEAIRANPADFTPEKIANASRASLGAEVKGALDERIAAKSETGSGYTAFKQSMEPIKVEPKFLADTLQKQTGLVLDRKGKFTAGAKSPVDSPTDVAKVQRLYDAWNPYFKRGTITADDFLTLREKLAGIANYEGVGKSKPLDSAAAGTRTALNTAYRDQIKGLDTTDADYTAHSTELKALRKGILDKDGNLTDSAINRIANAAGKGKDAQLARLEEIKPGITLRIRQLKAIEDIQNIHKVGTYTKTAANTVEGGGLVGGLVTGNLPLAAASVAAIILSQPEVAVRMIRTSGMAGPLAAKVLDLLKKGGSATNNLPNTKVGQVSVFGRQPQLAAPAGQ